MILLKRNWWKSFNVFWQLPTLKKFNLFKIAIYLVFFKVALKMLPFNKFINFFKFLIRTNKSIQYNSGIIFDISENVKTVSNNLVFHSTCLIQALTTKLLLRFDKNIVLIIGVCLKNGFEAHAWIEKDGNYIVGDEAVANFTPILCLK